MQVLTDADAVAKEAAKWIAAEARAAISSRGIFTMAVSGGKTPWAMLRNLATECLPWESVHIFQVDERIAPAGDPDRNLTHLRASLGPNEASVRSIHPMPVEGPDLQAAASDYAGELKKFAGGPPMLDLVHLGLGGDGHTASLVPGDPVLNIMDREVALTKEYLGRCRMTLTYPILNGARRILWLVTGTEKAGMLVRLLKADRTIPAGRILQNQALVLADTAAAGLRSPE